MPLSNEDFLFVRTFLEKQSAICLEDGKAYLVEAKLGKLAQKEGMSSIGELLANLRGGKVQELASKVVAAMTTNESSFFRDIYPFEALRKEILPPLFAARSLTRTLNIWSAACAGGQEAYSIAMTIREHFPETSKWRIRILCTDISEEMLERTREGVFTQVEVNRGVSAPMLVKYFRQAETKWRVSDDLRQMLDVQYLNLAGAWPAMPRMDIIFLRNVLIYFGIETRKTILRRLQQALMPDGALFLGSAETTLNLDDSYQRIVLPRGVYFRRGGQPPPEAVVRRENQERTMESYSKPECRDEKRQSFDINRVQRALHEVTRMIWDPHLGGNALTTALHWNPAAKARGACVHVLGGWNGSVSIECSPELADRATASILGRRGMGDDWREVLMEFVNMTGGNAKGSLGEGCLLSLPKSFEAPSFGHSVPGTEVALELRFTSAGHNLLVRLHRGPQRPAAE